LNPLIDESPGSDEGDRQFVFNMVWTDSVFGYFSPFLVSLMDHSRARFRLVANRCPPDEIARMERFAARHASRIVEVLEVSSTQMVPHGTALDVVRDRRHDGKYFCFIDPDILARDRFLPLFIDLLETNDAVTSGTSVWAGGGVAKPGDPLLRGEYAFDDQGYVFGSPHVAIYERAALDATCESWGVALGSSGIDLPDKVRSRLAQIGQVFQLYDTAKIVNMLFQEDGNRFSHVAQPALMHIGGMLHYFSADQVANAEGEMEPDWAHWKGLNDRFEVARYTAIVLRELSRGRAAPPIPATVPASMAASLATVRHELTHLVETYGADEPMVRSDP
jgi:hypothetical protein